MPATPAADHLNRVADSYFDLLSRRDSYRLDSSLYDQVSRLALKKAARIAAPQAHSMPFRSRILPTLPSPSSFLPARLASRLEPESFAQRRALRRPHPLRPPRPPRPQLVPLSSSPRRRSCSLLVTSLVSPFYLLLPSRLVPPSSSRVCDPCPLLFSSVSFLRCLQALFCSRLGLSLIARSTRAQSDGGVSWSTSPRFRLRL